MYWSSIYFRPHILYQMHFTKERRKFQPVYGAIKRVILCDLSWAKLTVAMVTQYCSQVANSMLVASRSLLCYSIIAQSSYWSVKKQPLFLLSTDIINLVDPGGNSGVRTTIAIRMKDRRCISTGKSKEISKIVMNKTQ